MLIKEVIKSLSLPDQCLVHRYLYYVLDSPIISDYEYDILEEAAKKKVGDYHLLNSPGSSLRSSYPDYIINLIEQIERVDRQ